MVPPTPDLFQHLFFSCNFFFLAYCMLFTVGSSLTPFCFSSLPVFPLSFIWRITVYWGEDNEVAQILTILITNILTFRSTGKTWHLWSCASLFRSNFSQKKGQKIYIYRYEPGNHSSACLISLIAILMFYWDYFFYSKCILIKTLTEIERPGVRENQKRPDWIYSYKYTDMDHPKGSAVHTVHTW